MRLHEFFSELKACRVMIVGSRVLRGQQILLLAPFAIQRRMHYLRDSSLVIQSRGPTGASVRRPARS